MASIYARKQNHAVTSTRVGPTAFLLSTARDGATTVMAVFAKHRFYDDY